MLAHLCHRFIGIHHAKPVCRLFRHGCLFAHYSHNRILCLTKIVRIVYRLRFLIKEVCILQCHLLSELVSCNAVLSSFRKHSFHKVNHLPAFLRMIQFFNLCIIQISTQT